MELRLALILAFSLPFVVCSAGAGEPSNLPEISEDQDMARIMGGEIAKVRDYPYQVSFQLGIRRYWRHFCAGAIIKNRWILTAASCFDDIEDLKTVRVVAGTIYWRKNRQVAEIKKVIPHNKYNNETGNKDIAMVKIDPPLDLTSEFVDLVTLPKRKRDLTDAMTTATGWGLEEEDDTRMTRKLQVANLKVFGTKLCHKMYAAIDKEVTPNMLCAAYPGRGPCTGDVGSPLVINGTRELIGIYNFGDGCDSGKNPAVYARIPKFNKWIKGNLD